MPRSQFYTSNSMDSPAPPTIRTSHLPNPRARLRDLGCIQPGGIALLPTNLESAESITDFRQAPEAATVAKLLTQAGLPPSDLWTREQRPGYIQNNAFEWIAPTLFISAALLTENPASVSVALGVIANYATDFLRGIPGGKNNKVKLEVVAEPSEHGVCKRFQYEGPPDQLNALPEVIGSVLRE